MLLYGATVAFNEEKQKKLNQKQKRTDVIPKDYFYGLQQRYKYIILQYSYSGRQSYLKKETKRKKRVKEKTL